MKSVIPRTTVDARRTAVVALSATALLLTGCGTGVTNDAGRTSSGEAVTIENCGTDVIVNGAPKAVVGMHPAQTEVLLRLGLADTLVGQAQASAQQLPEDVVALAKDVPVLGGNMPPSREDLLSVEPDFVYSPTTYEFSADKGFASIEQLNDAGAKVYVATGGCQDRRMSGEVADLFTDLANLGEIFGVQDKAAALIKENQAILDELAAATADVDKLRVAEVFVEGDTPEVIGAGVEYDILTRAGAEPIFTPDQEMFSDFFSAAISPEALAAEAPDALVIYPYDEDNEAMMRKYLTSTFPDMPAVRNDLIISLPSSDKFPGTLGNVTAARTIAQALYPDAF